MVLTGEPSAYRGLCLYEFRFLTSVDYYINDKHCIIKWKSLYVDLLALLKSVARHLRNLILSMHRYWRKIAMAIQRDAGSLENWNDIFDKFHYQIYHHIDNKIRTKIRKQLSTKPSSKRLIDRVDNFIMLVRLHWTYVQDLPIIHGYWLLRQLVGVYSSRIMCDTRTTIRNISNNMLLEKNKTLTQRNYYIGKMLKKVIRKILIYRYDTTIGRTIRPVMTVGPHNGLMFEVVKKLLDIDPQSYYSLVDFKLLR